MLTYVFPAPAGVILFACLLTVPSGCFPRTCGGDPSRLRSGVGELGFSPHLRG